MEKRLYRSRTDRMIWGVCGGLADYFNIDATVIRLIFVLLVFANGIGVLAYIIMAIVVPLEGSKSATPGEVVKENVAEMRESASEIGGKVRTTVQEAKESEAPEHKYHRARTAFGLVIIVLGALLLLSSLDLFWWFHWSTLWPLVVIAIGVLLILSVRRR